MTANGAGLALANYVFEIGDGGLSVTERGTMRGTMDGQEQYMVGLVEDALVPDPVAYVRTLHFPGEPPGISLAEYLAQMRL